MQNTSQTTTYQDIQDILRTHAPPRPTDPWCDLYRTACHACDEDSFEDAWDTLNAMILDGSDLPFNHPIPASLSAIVATAAYQWTYHTPIHGTVVAVIPLYHNYLCILDDGRTIDRYGHECPSIRMGIESIDTDNDIDDWDD